MDLAKVGAYFQALDTTFRQVSTAYLRGSTHRWSVYLSCCSTPWALATPRKVNTSLIKLEVILLLIIVLSGMCEYSTNATASFQASLYSDCLQLYGVFFESIPTVQSVVVDQIKHLNAHINSLEGVLSWSAHHDGGMGFHSYKTGV